MPNTVGGLNVIKVTVPEGFPPQSLPCDPKTRISSDNIIISRAQAEDMETIAGMLHESFPDFWWKKHEPLEQRPSEEVRRRRMGKRLSIWTKHPDMHGMKAVERSTGEIMGFAGWHARERRATIGGFRKDIVKSESEGGYDAQRLMGWSDEDVREMWEGVDVESWDGEFSSYDAVRNEGLSSNSNSSDTDSSTKTNAAPPTEPHWYLAPIIIAPRFRGRGVGRSLMDYAIDKADSTTPPTLMYLESFPNAVPVYLLLGFVGWSDGGKEASGKVGLEGSGKSEGRETVMIRRGPVRLSV